MDHEAWQDPHLPEIDAFDPEQVGAKRLPWQTFTGDWSNIGLLIVELDATPATFAESLYSWYLPLSKAQVLHIQPRTKSADDAAIEDLLFEALKRYIPVCLLGNGPHVLSHHVAPYAKLESDVNLTLFQPTYQVEREGPQNIFEIVRPIAHQLETLTVAGTMEFRVAEVDRRAAKELAFVEVGLGELLEDLNLLEALVRLAHLVHLNVGELLQGPHNGFGFSAQQLAQLGHYLGASAQARSLSLEIPPAEAGATGGHALAGIVWHWLRSMGQFANLDGLWFDEKRYQKHSVMPPASQGQVPIQLFFDPEFERWWLQPTQPDQSLQPITRTEAKTALEAYELPRRFQ